MIFTAPGSTFEASFSSYPGLLGDVYVRVIDTPGDVIKVARTNTGITNRPAGSAFYFVALTAPEEAGTYSIVWDTGEDEPDAFEELVVGYTHPATVTGPTFATAEDVANRLGRALTEAEEDQVEYLLLAATTILTSAAGKDAEWAASPAVPPIFRFICADMVARALSAPVGVQSTSESLGEYSVTDRFSDYEGGSMGLWLSAEERALIRSLFGLRSCSVRIESIVHDLYPT